MTAGSEGVVPVTQGDIDAATEARHHQLGYRVRIGERHHLVQAFARHRLAVLADQRDERGGESLLIAELTAASVTASQAFRMLAEAKSLRQSDNPEGRRDLYSWPSPEQTLEGRAALALAASSMPSTPTDTRGGESALREALERIVAKKPRSEKHDGLAGWRCGHCGYVWFEGAPERHGPDCAYVIARAALASSAAPGGVGETVAEVMELARRDVARTQTDFLGRMAEALCTYEGIFDEYPDGDLPDDVREEADDQISALAGLALAQLAILRSPTDPTALLAARPPLSGERT